jgi:hypothetical protein
MIGPARHNRAVELVELRDARDGAELSTRFWV